MELRVQLVPHLLGEAEFAELGEHALEEALLLGGQVALCNFDQHWLCLSQITPSCLAQKKSQERAHSALGCLSQMDHILEDLLSELVFELAFELFERLDLLRLLDQ